MREVPATEFARNFGQYREIAQREPIAVTSHGRAMGYFISAVEFEEMQRLKAFARRSRAVADLIKEEIDQMNAGRMGAWYGSCTRCWIGDSQEVDGAAWPAAWAGSRQGDRDAPPRVAERALGHGPVATAAASRQDRCGKGG